MPKYGNKKSQASDGTVFASARERKHYEDLLLLQKIGEINGLQTQVKWTLIPRQTGERACTYTSDFQYFDREGKLHVVDAKGCKTQQYVIRRKLMQWIHGVRIEEV